MKEQGVISFTRPLRTRAVPESRTIEIRQPEQPPAPKPFSFAPLATTIVSTGVLVAVMAKLKPSGGSPILFIAFPLAAGFAGAVVQVGVWFQSKRKSKKEAARIKAAYDEYLNQVKQELAVASSVEQLTLDELFPLAHGCVSRARERDPRLWERRPNDPDFLTVRVGTGESRASVGASFRGTGTDPLSQQARALADGFSVLSSAPTTVDLRAGGLGLAGDGRRIRELLQSLIVQLATMHAPGELGLAFVGVSDLDLHLLPQVASLTFAPVAKDTAEATALVEDILGSGGDAAGDRRRLVVVIDETETTILEERQLFRLLKEGPTEGVVAVLARPDKNAIPGEGMATIVVCNPNGQASLNDSSSRGRNLMLDSLDRAETIQCIRELAPLRLLDPSGARPLPEVAPLTELLGFTDNVSAAIFDRWNRWDGRLRLPLGFGKNSTIELDIERDGPHGLVAGRSGWGKSEALLSICLGLAARIPSEHLHFLFIDFKGEAAFGPLMELPHASYLLSNLDQEGTRRILVSLDAELESRQRLFASRGAKDIHDYLARTGEKFPRLMILVDEFFEMKRDAPEFVSGLVRVATIGRSLGVHLVLATQRPAGVVDEQIRANMGFWLCLLVNSSSDSQEMLGSDVASRIRVKGRGFLRTQEGTELLQVAFTGARAGRNESEAALEVREIQDPIAGRTTVHGNIRITGLGSRRSRRAEAEEGPAGETDLAILLKAIGSAAAQRGSTRAPSPVPPPLPRILTLEGLDEPADGWVRLGLLDEPELQRTVPFDIDANETAAIAVVGAPGSGKTMTLKTLALSMARSRPPRELQIIGIDFGSRRLSPLRHLPHTRAIVAADDLERLRRTLRILDREISNRSDRIARGDDARLPRLLVLIDNFPELVSLLQRLDRGELLDRLQTTIGMLRGTNVNLAYTATRREAIPAWLQAISTPVLLRQSERIQYEWAGLPPREAPEHLAAGSAIFNRHLAKIALPCFGLPADRAVDSSVEGIATVAGRWQQEVSAPLIEDLPRILERQVDANSHRLFFLGKDDDLENVELDLASYGSLLVVGGPKTGRSTALLEIAHWYQGLNIGRITTFIPRPTPLAEFEAAHARSPEEMADTITWLEQSGEQMLVLLDDAEALPPNLSDRLGRLVETSRGQMIFVGSASTAKMRAPSGVLRALRDQPYGLLLAPENPLSDGDAFMLSLPARSGLVFSPGRGYLKGDGPLRLVQVAVSSS